METQNVVAQDNRLLIRVDEAAVRLGLSRREVYRMISSGELPSVVVGRRSRRIVVADLVAAAETTRPRRSRRRRRWTAEEAEAAIASPLNVVTEDLP